MTEFLSDEWIAALGDAARARADDTTAEHSLVVEPVVRGVPGRGDVRYRVVCGATVRGVGPVSGDAPADVRLETDYATAVALARGETNGQTALADGLLTVSGDVARLATHAAALARLSDLFAAVRSTTTFPAVPDRASGQRS